MSPLAVIGNLLWLLLGAGLPCFLFWVLAGVLLTLTVVGIPFAVAAFRIAGFAALPFGRQLVDAEMVGEGRITGTTVANVLWIVLAGLWLSIFHAVAGVVYCITVIGIPFGLAHFKLAAVSFAPLGKRTVSTDAAALLEA